MAHFAELDINNKILRVVVACNKDIENNGGEQSEQAAEHFKSVCPLSENGVKWIQTSYNHNFRGRFAGINGTFDPIKNKFIVAKPYESWYLNSEDEWQAPVSYPTITTFGDNVKYIISWDEINKRWIGIDDKFNQFVWIPSSLSWIATGE